MNDPERSWTIVIDNERSWSIMNVHTWLIMNVHAWTFVNVHSPKWTFIIYSYEEPYLYCRKLYVLLKEISYIMKFKSEICILKLTITPRIKIQYFYRIYPTSVTVPYRTVPYRTVPNRTVPHRTVPHRTVIFSLL